MVDSAVSAGLNAFLSQAPEGAREALCLLAQAESLTDATAEQIYNLAPVEGVAAGAFIRALHYTDLIRPRNSEWHFTSAVRADLLAREAPAKSLTAAHELLVFIARHGDRAEARTRIPSYLFTEAGEAYHLAELGEVQAALPLYSAAALKPLDGRQWLAERLASEQESRHRIPEGTIEVTFLRGMLLYREGKKAEAMTLFRLLADRSDERLEVAIAQHLYANSIAKQDFAGAESYYRRSVAINERHGQPEHVAEVLHSLANLLSGRRSRWGEAEVIYGQALKIEEEEKGSISRGRLMHSLGNFLSRNPQRLVEAEEAFREALKHEEADPVMAYQVLNSLGKLIARNPERSEEAEATYLQSLEKGAHNAFHKAQVLHSLAILVARDETRRREAEELYRESLRIGEKNPNHVAQTLRSLALLVQNWSVADAIRLLQRSLEVNRQIKNTEGVRRVEKSLRDLSNRS